MAQEPVNYEAVLADLRVKRASLDAAIAAIEQLQTVGGMSSEATALPKTIDPSSIPDDAFFGLSVVDAAKKYLTIVKRKQSVKEIADALDRGGLPHSSSNFVATVATMLRRANDSDLVKVGRGDWGLAGWYGSRRPKPEPVPKSRPRRSRATRKVATATHSNRAPKSAIGGAQGTIYDHVEAALREHGAPMEVAALLQKVSERAGRQVARATLVGMLAEKVRKGERFSRPAPSTYALAG
jgi:hypothetical protein